MRSRRSGGSIIVAFPVPSQEIKVVQLVPVLHDASLDLGRVHPRDKVLHVPIATKSATRVRVRRLEKCERVRWGQISGAQNAFGDNRIAGS